MSSKPTRQSGFSLVEMIVTIVLFGVMAAVGSLLVGKLAPSYLANVQAEQALSPREAALQRLSEDFRRSLIDGTSQAGCILTVAVASGVAGVSGTTVVSQTGVYQWFPGNNQLWLSAPWVSSVSGILLNNVTPVGACPFTYVSGIATGSRAQLNVSFVYSTGGNDPVAMPVVVSMYSYANGPYVAAISPVTGVVGLTIPVTISGIFPGMGMGIASSVTFMSGLVPVPTVLMGGATSSVIFAKISSVSPALVDVRVRTTEGYSNFISAFRFQ